MKLSEHVDKLRNLIENSFDKSLTLMGIGSDGPGETKRPELAQHRERFEPMMQNHKGETGTYEKARAKLVDELTFTLFNRFAAIKVMETANMFPPVLNRQAEHGGRSFGHKVWLEERPHMRDEELEGLSEYIEHVFAELGATLPLYKQDYPYGLLPDVISLSEIIKAFNDIEKDSQAGTDIWHSDDILGWLYESYNNARKKEFKDSKKKVEYNKVSLQSQVYTPGWVVKFLVDNSLGKLYLEMYPDSEFKDQHKIANAPQKQLHQPRPVQDIKLIDPACGSGNFLLYAFDLFYEMYLDRLENSDVDYEKTDIPRLIIENNLHGIDLDDRAVQIAQLGLYIKARKKNRKIADLRFKVVSSDFYLPDYEEVRQIFEDGSTLDDEQKQLIQDVWSDLRFAYKFGSLIQLDAKFNARINKSLARRKKSAGKLFTDEELGIPPKSQQLELFVEQDIKAEKEFKAEFFSRLKTAVARYATSQKNNFLTGKTRDAIVFLELLTNKYDVATANPPYTDSSDFGPELKTFIEVNYKKPHAFHTNLYATFIKRCYDLASDTGKVALVHPPTFMYIKTFEDVRKFMLNKTHIGLFVEWGYLGMFNPSARVDSAMYVVEKQLKNQPDSIFIKLNHLYETKRYEALFEALDDYISGLENQHNYTIPQEKLKIIKSWPFIYWISDDFRQKFAELLIEKVADIRAGIQTSNNNRFLRFWWEVKKKEILLENDNNKTDKKWVLYSKGGPYQKWFGNLWLTIDWDESGKKLQNYLISRGQDLHAQEYYFKNGLTYSASGSKGISLRFLPSNHLFDIGGSSIFLMNDYKNIFYLMGFLNSKLVFYIVDCLNPTVNMQPSDLKRIPFVKPEIKIESCVTKLSKRCYEICRLLRAYSLPEINFVKSPFEFFLKSETKNSVKSFFNYENHLTTQVVLCESILNDQVFKVFNLGDHDKKMILAKEGESIGGLPVSAEARSAYMIENDASKEFPLADIKDFIEALPVKEFTHDERIAIENEFPKLYTEHNDLEGFCTRHQINPINVWYWFKQSNVIPKQRMHTLAMEFLADMIRTILMRDEDGIAPLVENAGEKTLLERIEEEFTAKGFSMAQFASFDSLIGKPLNEYLNKNFFKELSDHLNLFMYLPKTPFIWHLSSGSEQGFACYLIIYKWSRDKLMRLRSVYIEHRERALKNRQSDIAELNTAAAQNEKDRIFKQLKEIESFKEKIDDLLASGYNPILDDGVGKNIAPLQKRKMITYDVLNAGQLKKYLNADW
jgi:hypothetical protein